MLCVWSYGYSPNRPKGRGLMKHVYSFDAFGGFMNCSECDQDTAVNKYDRDDGLKVWFCKKCEDRLHL